MVLPDYRSGRNERDVQVNNVSLSLDNGKCLLESGQLKLVHQRRYGLVGKNGIGKTTLFKAIAAMETEGWPRHLRGFHVRQELKTRADDTAVLTAVLEADAERNAFREINFIISLRLLGLYRRYINNWLGCFTVLQIFWCSILQWWMR
jgi:ATP-binding cassette subfamily F protein 3